jgi:hypothetical protein
MFSCIMSWDSLFCIVTRLRAGQFLAGARGFSPLCRVETGSGVYPPSYPVVIEGRISGSKVAMT